MRKVGAEIPFEKVNFCITRTPPILPTANYFLISFGHVKQPVAGLQERVFVQHGKVWQTPFNTYVITPDLKNNE
ncbi:unnamed protein product, partial [Nesidiocoris tenuis]